MYIYMYLIATGILVHVHIAIRVQGSTCSTYEELSHINRYRDLPGYVLV